MSYICHRCILSTKRIRSSYFRRIANIEPTSGCLTQIIRDYNAGSKRHCVPTLQQIYPIKCVSKQLLINYQSVRTAFHLPNPFRKRQNYRPIDNVPDNYRCVYVSPMNTYIAYIYPLAVISAALTLVIVSKHILFSDPGTYLTIQNVKESYTGQMSNVQLAFGAAFTTVFGITIWQVSVRSPLRIYYEEEEEKFIASFPTLRPWKSVSVEFKPGDVSHKYPMDSDAQIATPRTFLGEYVLHDRRIILIPNRFDQPHYYNLMLGLAGKGHIRQDD